MNNPPVPSQGKGLPAWGQVLLLAAAAALVYSNTLDVPFYFDDKKSIVDNTTIHSLQNIASIWNKNPFRFISYLSFAINYHFHGVNVYGYHFVNIVIHFLAAFSLWGLIRGLLRTPAVKGKLDTRIEYWLPIIASLLFVLHPLQTQAVTYVVQRSAAIAALFYITSMAAYVQVRLADKNIKRILWSVGVLLSVILAFLSKQNTVTIPLAIILTEAVFFPLYKKKVFSLLAFLALGVGVMLAIIHFGFETTPFSLETLDKMTRETKMISRPDYLATQMLVLWQYVLKFFYPIGLHLDHDFPLAHGFSQGKVLLAAGGHLLVLFISFFYARRYPLLFFAAAIFYVTHLVESGAIPIRDVFFEHRMYLPMIGLCITVAFFILHFIRGKYSGRSVTAVSLLIFFTLGLLTWNRNTVWRDPVALWSDNVAKAPMKARPHHNLGRVLVLKGNTDDGIVSFRKAIELDPEYVLAYNGIGIALTKKGDPALAVEYLQIGLTQDPHYEELHFNAGVAFAKLGNSNKAIAHYRKALAASPEYDSARNNLANLLYKEGFVDEAIKHYHIAIRNSTDNTKPYYNLAAIYFMEEKSSESLPLLQKVLTINPKDADALILLGAVFTEQEKYSLAQETYEKALRLAPDLKGQISYNLACLYALQKDIPKTLVFLNDAINAGFDNWEHLETDSDLDIIRNEPFYQDLINRKTGR